MTVAAAILAAGASRRLGSPKQLVRHRGVPLVRAVVREVCAAGCDRVAVILGANATEVVPVLAGLAVELEVNTAWREGVASSIRRAVAWARSIGAHTLALATCDQALLTAAHLDALLALHARTGSIAASRYADRAGIPAVFGARDFTELAALRGDAGARALLETRRVATVDWDDGVHDVDTPEDVVRIA